MDYDITKKLKFTFNANNRSMFEEGDGAVEAKFIQRHIEFSVKDVRTSDGLLTQLLVQIHFAIQPNSCNGLDECECNVERIVQLATWTIGST